MPILDVEIVIATGSDLPKALAAQLAEAAGEVFGSLPGRTWVKLRALTQDQYAENGGGPPVNVLPVFVSVLKGEIPAPAELREEARALAEAIAHICQRPTENVHILYLPEAEGRIAFRGKLPAG